jgi:eukaryotic-like serine/threonine-protein kinase
MPAPATTDDFLSLTRQSGLLDEKDLEAYLRTRGEVLPASPSDLAAEMVGAGLLTGFQASQFLKGKWRGFVIAGKYKLLEHLGSGGMANVFLCEHMNMHRRVALKVLPPSQTKDPGVVERFYREARAVATLDHPNIVRAHDIDHDAKLHFLVMEYVDGSSLQDIVRKHGPLPIDRAAHYVRQAAVGLDAAHHAGVVHRDIKPGNILVDRTGVVKILDMGLARFFRDEGDDLTKKFDENCVLGTADYCAPEQALNSHAVDSRVDIYSLGATLYYCLTGRTPFGNGTTAQKIIWHQMKEPPPIRELRPDVPPGLAAVVAKMMAKQLEDRYQLPAEVFEALTPWGAGEVSPPAEDEMPKLCPRSQGPGSTDPSSIRRSAAPTMVQPRTPRPGPLSVIAEPTAITPRQGNGSAKAAKSGKARVTETEPETDEPAFTSGQPKWLLPAVIGGAALLFLILGSLGLWWVFSDHNKPGAVAIGPPSGNATETGRPQPNDPGKLPVQPLVAGREDVAITEVGKGRRIHTPKYDAVIADDGNMTSLKIGGVEFFKSGLKFGNQEARGAYVFSQSVLSLPRIEQSGNVVTTSSDLASVGHEFHPSSIRWTVTNRSDREQLFYIVFDKNVRAVTDGKEWAEVPAPVPDNAPPMFQVAHDWPNTTWFAGRAKLALVGGTRIWGQFPNLKDNYQVWQLTLPPHKSHEVSVNVGEATPEEEAKVAQVTGKVEPPPLSVDGITIKAEKDGYRVLAPKYVANIDKDGCVTSLKIAGVELLCPGISFSRGSYFHQNEEKIVPMPQVEQPSTNVVRAKGDRSSARYEFGRDAMTWTVTNATDQQMNFYLVFTTAVKSVTNGEETVKTPVVKDWPITTWDFGKGRLKISGGTRIWGPWPSPKENSQVCHVDLAPHETRKVTFQLLDVPDRAAGVDLESPRDYQVFQRRTRKEGTVTVRGTAPAGCDTVEARLSGSSLEGALPDRWQTLYPAADRRGFSATLPTPAGGWYKLEVRALREKKVVAQETVDHVGVGEVFVMAGQSNSANSGEERQKTTSQLVSSFGGDDWRSADDPQPGVNDGSSGGSPWPVFGDALAAKYKVPIGIASTGRGGTSVNEWRADGDLFRWMTKRMEALGPHGFRAVLWHQGEADFGTSADDYAKGMTEIIHASQKAAGWDVPWFVAQVSYLNPGSAASPSTRAGQKKLWETKVALEGPDTDALGGDNRDAGGKGIHFSAKGLRAHGKLWADKVSSYLDTILAE